MVSKKKPQTVRYCATLFAFLALSLAVHEPACAEWQPDTGDRRERKAAKQLEKFKAQERLDSFFQDAYGYAIFSGAARLGIGGAGGAHGRGLLIEQERVVGRVTFWQFSLGIQAGAQAYSKIIFFKDREAIEDFKAGNWEFAGQAGGAAFTAGASREASYTEGVAIFTRTKGGLMYEATAAGLKFKFRPLPPEKLARPSTSEVPGELQEDAGARGQLDARHAGVDTAELRSAGPQGQVDSPQ